MLYIKIARRLLRHCERHIVGNLVLRATNGSTPLQTHIKIVRVKRVALSEMSHDL